MFIVLIFCDKKKRKKEKKKEKYCIPYQTMIFFQLKNLFRFAFTTNTGVWLGAVYYIFIYEFNNCAEQINLEHRRTENQR